MSEINLESLIQNYLDSIYVISHSKSSVDVYKSGINHLRKFVQIQYDQSLEQIIPKLKDDSMDRYKIFKDFVIYLDKAGKKPASIQIWVVGAKGFLKHCGIRIYSEDFKMSVRLPKRVRCREEPMTKEIMLRLLNNVPAKLRTIILVTSSSGMRIGETKHAWISFVTSQTIVFINEYLGERFSDGIDPEANLFTIHSRSLQNTFKSISEKTGIVINPHLLRTVFSEKCTKANLKDKYIDAFCGRVSQGVLATNYTYYSSESLRVQYDKIESLLELDL